MVHLHQVMVQVEVPSAVGCQAGSPRLDSPASQAGPNSPPPVLDSRRSLPLRPAECREEASEAGSNHPYVCCNIILTLRDELMLFSVYLV